MMTTKLSPADQLRAAISEEAIAGSELQAAQADLDEKKRLLDEPIAGGRMAHLLCEELGAIRREQQSDWRVAQEKFDAANQRYLQAKAALETAKTGVA